MANETIVMNESEEEAAVRMKHLGQLEYPVPEPSADGAIKVWSLYGGAYWVAAATPEDAIRGLREWQAFTGADPEIDADYGDPEPEALTAEQLANAKFQWDDDVTACSFAAWLAGMLATPGQEFPAFFAVADY